jgi:hypothetical protein
MKIIIFTSEKIKPTGTSHTVDVVSWSNASAAKVNLRDYDGVVFDMTSRNAEKDVSLWWFEDDTVTPEITFDILKRQGSFIVILGDPNTILKNETISRRIGLVIENIKGHGDNLCQVDDSQMFAKYLQQIKTYSYSFRTIPSLTDDMKSLLIGNSKYKAGAALNNFLQTKAQYAVAAEITPFICTLNNSGQINYKKEVTSGKLILLPPLKDGIAKSIDGILEVLAPNKGYDIAEPDWASEISVVGQSKIDGSISNNQAKLEKLSAEKTGLLNQKIELRRSVEILYKSDKPLETSIKDYFRKVGIKVVEPKITNKAEFSFEYSSKKFVVEVKSTSKEQFDQKGLRQVNEWRDDYLVETGECYKPVLIASNQYNLPPNERNSDYLPDNLKKYAVDKDIAVISVRDIFDNLQSVEAETGKLDDFINNIYDTKGIFKTTKEPKKAVRKT